MSKSTIDWGDDIAVGEPTASEASSGHVHYHPQLIQGSDEWLAARCGLLTASEMKLIIAPPPEPETRVKKNGEPYKQREWDPVADNDKCRIHLYELLAQRITRYVEPQYISDDMLRGQVDEVEARMLYEQHYAPVADMGFITNDKFGFTIGYSPDGLVGDDGLIEAKSRRAKYQVQTVVENLGFDNGETIPPDYLIQLQTGLLVSERKWIDFISYSGGLPMVVIRCWPNEKVQNAIVEAAGEFERRLADRLAVYQGVSPPLIATERRIVHDMHI
jgi:hypothetical protein